MFKKSVLALSVLAATLTLAACDDDHEPTDEEAHEYVESEAKAEVQSQLASDEVDLKGNLEELKKTDPTVKDAYYDVDDKGVKQLHVIRENPGETDPEKATSDMIWPIVGGIAGGYLLHNIMSSGGVNHYAQSYPPSSQSYYSQEDQRKKKNQSSFGYTGWMMNNARSSITSSPSYRSNMRSSVISTRSSGAFFSPSSARSSGYGGGA